MLSGGLNAFYAQRKIWIYNEQSGWHLSNLKLPNAKYGHISMALNNSEISQRSKAEFVFVALFFMFVIPF